MSIASRGDYLQLYGLLPDRELLRWEKWIKIRKEEIKNLVLRTNKPPVDLIMNQCDKYREMKEQDDVLDNARIKSRPGDVFWELPDKLHQRCCCEGVYEVKRTKAELREVEFIEHVQVPNAIQKNEKGMLGASKRPTLTKLNAGYNEFKNIREHELKIDIKKIQSHKPDIAELIVHGSAPVNIETKELEYMTPKLPVIVFEDYSNRVPDPYNESLKEVYALRINDTIFKIDNTTKESQIFVKKSENENCYKDALTWSYYFNVHVKKIGRGKIILQNLGTVTIKYWFKRSLETDNYALLPIYSNKRCKQQFFFYKNEDLVTPGQTKEINITYFSDKPGIHEESWDLKILNVDFFKSSNEKIVICLVGETVEDTEKLNCNIQKLKEKIYHKADYLMVFNLLQEAITKAVTIKPEMYPYKDYFLEADLFVTINPEHYYHQTKVQKLKEIFIEMTGNEWDLSISTWRNAVVAKEFDERMIYYDVIKQANRDLFKPWSDDLDDLLRQKHRMVKLLLIVLIDKFYDERSRLSEAYILPDETIQDPKGDLKTPQEYLESSLAASPVEFKNINKSLSESSDDSNSSCITTYSRKNDLVRTVFYLHMYEHLDKTIETCAGVLSSLDLNRYVDYNMCPILN